VEATRQILAHLPKTRIIALSMHTHERAIAAMLEAGATAFIPKTSKAAELIKAIHAVSQGKTYITPGLKMPADIESPTENSDDDDIPLASLSLREHQVLALIANGYDTLAVAEKLNISGQTVASHRKNIMSKLHIDSVAGLTKYAIREGLSSI